VRTPASPAALQSASAGHLTRAQQAAAHRDRPAGYDDDDDDNDDDASGREENGRARRGAFMGGAFVAAVAVSGYCVRNAKATTGGSRAIAEMV
jgi:hypothetical protein